MIHEQIHNHLKYALVINDLAKESGIVCQHNLISMWGLINIQNLEASITHMSTGCPQRGNQSTNATETNWTRCYGMEKDIDNI